MIVASFTDAWIETLFGTIERIGETSHLLQMRGLKLSEPVDAKSAPVASFTDAWIETKSTLYALPSSSSHLLQMRGLKLNEVQQHER